VKNLLTADWISDFSENTTLYFVIFYQKIISTISPEFSFNLLFHIEYPLTTNPTIYVINEISYIWRPKISFSYWAPVTNSPSFNTYGNSEPNLRDEAQEPELEPIERSMRVSNLTEGLGVPEAGIRLSVDNDCNEEQQLDKELWVYLLSWC